MHYITQSFLKLIYTELKPLSNKNVYLASGMKFTDSQKQFCHINASNRLSILKINIYEGQRVTFLILQLNVYFSIHKQKMISESIFMPLSPYQLNSTLVLTNVLTCQKNKRHGILSFTPFEIIFPPPYFFHGVQPGERFLILCSIYAVLCFPLPPHPSLIQC